MIFCVFRFFQSTMDEPMLLRVHSRDLHDHLAVEVGRCLESGIFADVIIR